MVTVSNTFCCKNTSLGVIDKVEGSGTGIASMLRVGGSRSNKHGVGAITNAGVSQ